MAERMWDVEYERFLERSISIAISTKSNCNYCSAPATLENLMRIGSQQIPYHMDVYGQGRRSQIKSFNEKH